MWRVTLGCAGLGQRLVISIHTLRVEGDQTEEYKDMPLLISIHTLRVEGDLDVINRELLQPYFYPHPPCGG